MQRINRAARCCKALINDLESPMQLQSTGWINPQPAAMFGSETRTGPRDTTRLCLALERVCMREQERERGRESDREKEREKEVGRLTERIINESSLPSPCCTLQAGRPGRLQRSPAPAGPGAAAEIAVK